MAPKWYISLLGMLAALFFMTSSAFALDDGKIAEVVKGGQKYLLDSFIVDPENTDRGYWSTSGSGTWPSLPDTAAAAAALLETGKYPDPAYQAAIDKAVKYILEVYVQEDGGIYSSSWQAVYQTGLSLVALGLYGNAIGPNNELQAAVSKAMDYLEQAQDSEVGGWGYSMGDTHNDLSNAQFAVMGLFYGSNYLGIRIDASEPDSWAAKVYRWLKEDMQQESGVFWYTKWGPYTDESMTGAGIWVLAMIGKSNSDEVMKGVNWFAENYRWTLEGWGGPKRDYYFVYTMAKALAATVGQKGKVGDNEWLSDLKQTLLDQAIPGDDDIYTWSDQHWLSGYEPLTVGFVLMSLGFADPNVEGPQKLLPENPDTDVPEPNRGLVKMETVGGVTIARPNRVNVGRGQIPAAVELPVGGFDFVLSNVPIGGTADLKLYPPPGVFNKNNPTGFLDENGEIKSGLAWFKLQDGAWKGLGDVPIRLGPENGPYQYIVVTLRDGGPEDADGIANGQIVDPGAPGIGYSADDPPAPQPDPAPPQPDPVDPGEKTSGSGGCSISGSNSTTDPVLPMLVFLALLGLILRRSRKSY